jgi:hypothetical protein
MRRRSPHPVSIAKRGAITDNSTKDAPIALALRRLHRVASPFFKTTTNPHNPQPTTQHPTQKQKPKTNQPYMWREVISIAPAVPQDRKIWPGPRSGSTGALELSIAQWGRPWCSYCRSDCTPFGYGTSHVAVQRVLAHRDGTSRAAGAFLSARPRKLS